MPYNPYFNSYVPANLTNYQLSRLYPNQFRWTSVGGLTPTDGITNTDMGGYSGFQGWFSGANPQTNVNHNVNFTMPGNSSPSGYRLPAVVSNASRGSNSNAANSNVIDVDVVNSAPKSKKGGLKDWFSQHIGSGKSLLGGNLDWDKIKQMPSNIRNTNLFKGGPKLGTVGAVGMGLYQGFNAAKGLTENAQTEADYNNLINDIKSSAYANPMAAQYLTSDQRKLMRQARSGSLGANNFGGAMQGVAQGIPQALLSSLLGGLVGGGWGAFAGGAGSLINSGIQGYGNNMRQQTDKLNGLYDALQNAELSYNDQVSNRVRNRHFNYAY